MASGQIEFDLQGGKGVYRQKGADTWIPFKIAAPNIYLNIRGYDTRFIFERSAFDHFDLKIKGSQPHQVFTTTKYSCDGMDGEWESYAAGETIHTKDTIPGNDNFKYVVVALYNENNYDIHWL